MQKALAIASSLIVLTGCATRAPTVWTKADMVAYDRDHYECTRDARQVIPGAGIPAPVAGGGFFGGMAQGIAYGASRARVETDGSLYAMCMKARGYSPSEGGSRQASSSQRWTLVSEQESLANYLDELSIIREGHLGFVDVLSDLRAEALWQLGAKSMITRWAIDCSAQTMAVASVTAFAGPMATGTTKHNSARARDQWEFAAVDRRTVASAYVDRACARR